MPYYNTYNSYYYVYDATEEKALAAAIAEMVKTYLTEGDEGLNLKGLHESPKFLVRKGIVENSLAFYWNAENQSFTATVSDYEALKTAKPDASSLPIILIWTNSNWVSASVYELDSYPSAPYLEKQDENPETIVYLLGTGCEIPYDPEEPVSPMPTIVWQPGTASEDDQSVDNWIRSDGTPFQAEGDEDNEEGDSSVYGYATVVFGDDVSPGTPHVEISKVVANSALTSYDDEVNISTWTISMNIKSNEFMGTVSEGIDADTPSSALNGAVYHLLSNYEGLKHIGLTNPALEGGVYHKLVRDDNLESKDPITVTCEVYSFKDDVTERPDRDPDNSV